MTAARATRRAAAAAGVLSLALVLTACTGTGDAAPSTAPTASATPSEAVTPSTGATPSASAASSAGTAPSATTAPTPSGSAGTSTQRYLGFVQQFSPTLAALSPGVLVQLGQQVCTDFGRGRDAGQVAVALGASSAAPDLQATDAAVVIGAAVATLCPRYRARLQD